MTVIKSISCFCMSSSIVYSWKLQYFCELLFRKVQSIVSENCGLDNSVQALVASSRQDTTSLMFTDKGLVTLVT